MTNDTRSTQLLSDSASPDIIFEGLLSLAFEFAAEMREARAAAERLTRHATELERKVEQAQEIALAYAKLQGIPTDDSDFDDVA